MKKQIVKGFAMLTLLVVMALATAVVSANAQSTRVVAADVPFEFIVGDKKMPAAEYRVRPSNALGKSVLIQASDASSSAIRLTTSIESRKNNTHARLVFHRYGNRYFLAEVWTGSSDIGQALNKSRLERETQREFAAIASNGKATYDTVEILATLR